ncbi:DNA primase [Aliikangiella marina]|uniref:DNA primase n=1 Tax=Aliikangiella marina TaxID=1712262 RepID=A0A545TCB6_9GAMM|nr:DNA primase [Aliikangiella marina]TQV74863.1 DNA primase [Aliikangiella marina]
MAGRIPQSFINELLARCDLVEIIDRRVSLKKAGRNYTACCPFHNEKTPSFSVNPDKQFYYCFGCGASGNALTFLMEYEGQEFVAAIEDLAAQQGLEVPREAYSGSQQQQHNDLFPLMGKVANHYQQQLKNHPKAKRAIAYLKNRGLSGEIAKTYGMGFVPDGWQNLMHLDSDKEKLTKDLVATGMMIQKDDGRAYDRFRDRIMFPIRNRRGQVLGFGGRVIDKGEPKYLNSPETDLFHKGRELYGLFEMRRQMRNIDHVIIVEGYMDVVALAQFGIQNAAATLGTATTSEHLQTLFRICPKVVFCFDGDKAGRAAAVRALKHALPLVRETREVRLIFLPDGEDPDTLVRKIGADAFRQQVENATTLFDYLIEYLKSQVDMNTFEGPARLVHLAKPFYQEIKDAILAARFSARLCELSGLNQEQLAKVLEETNENQSVSSNSQQHPRANQDQKTHSANYSRAPNQQFGNPQPADSEQDSQQQSRATFRRAIALLLQFPDAMPAADLNWLQAIQDPGAQILFEMCQLLDKHEDMTTAMLIEHWRDRPEHPHLQKLAVSELHTHADNAQIEVCEIIKRLEKTYLLEQWDALIEKSKTQLLDESEKATLKQLQQAIHKN